MSLLDATLLDATPDPKDLEGPHASSLTPTVRPALAARRDADGALEDGVWMGRALALVRLAGDDVEGAVLVREHRFLGETASRERPERGVLRGRVGRDATLYLTHAPRDFARLAAIRESGVRRLVVCDSPSSAMLHEAKRSGLKLDVLDELDALCA
ncbi:MAG: hypothetical protein MUE69_20595 [Myxococcota bacterium]|jgi:hypothetical protein|nr:hypothetical protein [Myxococcota bacterium]